MKPEEYDLVERRAQQLSVARDAVYGFCAQWADMLRDAGGATLKTLEQLSTDAGIKAAQFAQAGVAFADWQPGNGTSYKVLLYDLRRPQADALAEAGRDPQDAHRMGPEASWGGRLLVAFPESGEAGRCRAMALTDLYHPSFVGEQFGFRGIGDAIPVAILLTFFGAAASVWLQEQVSA